MANALGPLRRRLRQRRQGGLFDPFERMHDEMDRLFSETLTAWPVARLGQTSEDAGDVFLSVDVKDAGDHLEVTVDVPGVEEKDIDVKLMDGALVFSGKRESHKEEERKGFFRSERSFGAFQRYVPLPCEVDEDRVEADMRNGVLKVTLAKSADAKQHERKIPVRSA